MLGLFPLLPRLDACITMSVVLQCRFACWLRLLAIHTHRLRDGAAGASSRSLVRMPTENRAAMMRIINRSNTCRAQAAVMMRTTAIEPEFFIDNAEAHTSVSKLSLAERQERWTRMWTSEWLWESRVWRVATKSRAMRVLQFELVRRCDSSLHRLTPALFTLHLSV